MKQIVITATLSATGVGQDVTPQIIRQAPFNRVLNAVAISGATINTATLKILKNNLEVTRLACGVTRAAGTPIDVIADAMVVGEFIAANDQLTFLVDSTAATTFYLYYDIDEEQD
jgi:hypothetical protein